MMHDNQEIRLVLTEKIAAYLPKDNAQLSQAMRYAIGDGGRLYRPLFAMYLGSVYSVREDKLFNIAVALEFLHTFTLVHDDIMDASPLRRGQPSVYSKWGTNLAILTGDALLAKSLEVLSYTNEQKTALLEILIRGLPALSRGQAIDLQESGQYHGGITDYMEMAALKTGTIFSMAGEMAAVVAGLPSAKVEQLKDFGTKIGIAYQIQDDYLDFFGDTSALKKSMGRDLVLRKRSLLVALGLKAAPAEFGKAIAIAPMDIDRGIELARNILMRTEVQAYVLEQQRLRLSELFRLVDEMPGNGRTVRNLLREMFQPFTDIHNP